MAGAKQTVVPPPSHHRIAERAFFAVLSRPRMGPYGGYILQTFVTLLAVCALAFVVLYGARRLGIGRPRGPIELVGQLPLDTRRAIYLVRVGGQVIVVGASEAGFTKLAEMAATDLPALPRNEAQPFGDILAKVLGRSKDARKSERVEPRDEPAEKD
jgi:flagellar protein FliO/FliZ